MVDALIENNAMLVKKILTTVILAAVVSCNTFADNSSSVNHHFFFGPIIGFGSTDWSMLVANPNSPAAAVSPIKAKDTGMVWGGLIGYQVSEHFQLIAKATVFPTSTITFDSFSPYFNYKNNYPVSITSATYAAALEGVFEISVSALPNIKPYALAGVGYVHRSDIIQSTGRVGANFGLGVNYLINHRLSTQLEFTYYTGYGKAEYLPADSFVPFLFALQASLSIYI